jgi:hypothetical protein
MNATVSVDLCRDAVGEAWEDLQNEIKRTVFLFCRKHRQDFDSAMTDAGLFFVEAFHKYDPSRGDFSTWICYSIWKGLKEDVRTFARRQNHTPMEGIGDRDFMEKKKPFDLQEFFENLSADGRIMAGIVLDPPAKILGMVKRKNFRKGSMLSSIRYYLEGMGWTPDRIRETFEEVQQVLD